MFLQRIRPAEEVLFPVFPSAILHIRLSSESLRSSSIGYRRD